MFSSFLLTWTTIDVQLFRSFCYAIQCFVPLRDGKRWSKSAGLMSNHGNRIDRMIRIVDLVYFNTLVNALKLKLINNEKFCDCLNSF